MASHPRPPYHRALFEAFRVFARARGWDVTRRGWPHFAAFLPDDGRMVAVVARPAAYRLRPPQLRLLRHLAAYGVPVYVFAPPDCLVRFDRVALAQPRRSPPRDRGRGGGGG